jgi:hypothetical protein
VREAALSVATRQEKLEAALVVAKEKEKMWLAGVRDLIDCSYGFNLKSFTL